MHEAPDALEHLAEECRATGEKDVLTHVEIQSPDHLVQTLETRSSIFRGLVALDLLFLPSEAIRQLQLAQSRSDPAASSNGGSINPTSEGRFEKPMTATGA